MTLSSVRCVTEESSGQNRNGCPQGAAVPTTVARKRFEDSTPAGWLSGLESRRHPVLPHGFDGGWYILVGYSQPLFRLLSGVRWIEKWAPVIIGAMKQDRQ